MNLTTTTKTVVVSTVTLNLSPEEARNLLNMAVRATWDVNMPKECLTLASDLRKSITEALLGDLISEDVLAEVKGLMRENKKIPAIKAIRTYTGVGLHEAKDFVESLNI